MDYVKVLISNLTSITLKKYDDLAEYNISSDGYRNVPILKLFFRMDIDDSNLMSKVTIASISDLIAFVSSLFMVFGGVVPYIPQYQMIRRSGDAQGFSTYVCLSLLVANILRILFWFGHPFEIPLLLQSIVMIICMLIMLELCIKTKYKVKHSSEKSFKDFNMEHFWQWTDFGSYVQFILSATFVAGVITYLFINVNTYVESIGNTPHAYFS